MLTIDQGSLRDLWLPAERAESEAVEYLWGQYMKAKPGSVADRALNVAVAEVKRVWRETVETIRERGGLLLIGGEF